MSVIKHLNNLQNHSITSTTKTMTTATCTSTVDVPVRS